MIERVGRWDCTRLGVLINPEKSPGGQERLIRGHILACEQLLQACEADERRRGQQQPEAAKREQPLTQVVVVMDLAGLGSGHMNRRLINCFQTINAIDEANYPELVGEIHVLNAGWFFGTLWAAIRPLIDTTTAKKVRVDHAHLGPATFPPDQEAGCWEQVHVGADHLVASVGAEFLPVELGGTRTDAAPYH